MKAICFTISIFLLCGGIAAVYMEESLAAPLFAFGFAFLLVSILIKKKKPASSSVSDQEPAALDRMEAQPADDPCVGDDSDAYIAFDLETTGLSPYADRIIEIGAVKVANSVIVEEFSQLVNPECPIPADVSAINHITNDMVAGQPRIQAALPSFLAFIGDLPCVAHNVSFDRSFLMAEAARCGLSISNPFSDSLKAARQYFPGLPNKKLVTVCEAIGYEIGQAHRALDDAKAVHAVIQACAARVDVMEAGKRAHEQHFELARRIEQQYASARESVDSRQQMMDAVLSLCREDFALVQPVREYCQMCAYPAPAFDSFRRAVIILAQRKDYDAAIQVCDQAIALDIPDPTMEGGMAARRDRLIRQRDTALAKATEAQEKEALRAEKRRAREEREKEKKAGSSNQKAILQYSYDGETLIKAHKSIAAAAREIGINSSCIGDALSGKQKHAGGFTWKRGETDELQNADHSVMAETEL